jgi:FixJ family two-component response regulator
VVTAREEQTLDLLLAGVPRPQIADQLGMADATDAHGIVALRDGILTLKAKSEQRHGITR